METLEIMADTIVANELDEMVARQARTAELARDHADFVAKLSAARPDDKGTELRARIAEHDAASQRLALSALIALAADVARSTALKYAAVSTTEES